MRKKVYILPYFVKYQFLALIVVLLSAQIAYSFTDQQLKNYAAQFPGMPRNSLDLSNNQNIIPTFGSGTPFNDLEYTLYDADYIDGENGGYDTFMPVKPSQPLPGSDTIKYVRCALNTDLNYVYGVASGARIILGTDEIAMPFFLKGPDGIDNDYAVIQHFDYDHGKIQLRGLPDDYALIYCTLDDGCSTEGYYLFYSKDNNLDLIAFIYPCWDLEPAVSGRLPSYPESLCNADGTLSLYNIDQFIFAQPLDTTPSIPNGIIQYGGNGKDVTTGITVDQDGNIYLFGFTDSQLGSVQAGQYKIFISKINTLGIQQWVTELPMKEGTFLFDAVTDSNYIYVCGRTLGNLPGFPKAKKWDGILLKLSLINGDIQASDQWGNEGIDGYGNIVLDDYGNLYVSGQGSPPGISNTNDTYLVAKHRCSDLSNLWRVIEPTVATGFAASAEAWGGITYVPSTTLAKERLIVAGWYMAGGGADAFVSVYEDIHNTYPTRAHSIVFAAAGQKADWVLDNTVDSNGNIYIAGYTTGDLGRTNIGQGDAFIIKYDSTLSNPQIKQFGTLRSDIIRKLEIDACDTIYAVGYTCGNYAKTNSDPQKNTADIIALKLDTSLKILNAIQIGTPYEDRAQTCLENEILYLAGTTEGTMVSRNLGSFDGFACALNTADLSVHSFAQSRIPDFNKDYNINLNDFAYMSHRWLWENCGQCEGADLTGDGNMDINDMSVFAVHWLSTY